MNWRVALLLAALGAGLAPSQASAQAPPTPAEAARYTGLHAAAWQGDTARTAAHCSTGGADPNPRDGHGRTPLHVATFARQRDALRLLAAVGRRPGGAGERPLRRRDHRRGGRRRGHACALLLQLGASAKLITSRYDGTALIAAAHLGHDGVVRQLIKAGAPLDHVNNLHWTALIEAIVLGHGGPRHVATLHALVEAGANTQLADRARAARRCSWRSSAATSRWCRSC